jgi:hypothetical protein
VYRLHNSGKNVMQIKQKLLPSTYSVTEFWYVPKCSLLVRYQSLGSLIIVVARSFDTILPTGLFTSLPITEDNIFGLWFVHARETLILEKALSSHVT